MCHNKRLKKKTDRQPQTKRSTKPKKFTLVQYAHKNLQNSINVQDQVADEFEKMSFYSMEDCGKKMLSERGIRLIGHYFTEQERCPRIKNQGGHRHGGKYTLLTYIPANVSRTCRPEWTTTSWHNTERISSTNSIQRSSIPLHRSIQIHCAYKGEWRLVKFYIVTSNGPTILGLPSLQDLRLVTLHCSIQRTKCAPVNHETNTPVTLSDNTNQLHKIPD